jgi:mannose-6-phosphate isomerase-like protein (cupin superfamily)
MRPGLMLVVVAMTFIWGSGAGRNRPLSQPAGQGGAIPLILEKEQGEQRVRRPRNNPIASGPFILKIDAKNGGSSHLILGTEEMAPGALIPRHKHLGQDEILLIQTSTAHVWLGDQERDVHAGGVVFVPSGTWISLRNTGGEILNLTFVFSAPGFDEYLRCTSVPNGRQIVAMTDDEFKECQHKGHAVFQAAEPQLSR